MSCATAVPARAGSAHGLTVPPQVGHLSFLLRRHPFFRHQMAQAVGKRLLSCRTLSSQRAQIVEHHRTAAWSEREYAALFELMRAHGARVLPPAITLFCHLQDRANVRTASQEQKSTYLLMHDYVPVMESSRRRRETMARYMRDAGLQDSMIRTEESSQWTRVSDFKSKRLEPQPET